MSKGNPEKRRRGRPALSDSEAKRAAIHVRTTANLRNRIIESAMAGGRSMAQEVEYRLERSFHDDRYGEVLLQSIYGNELATLLLLIGWHMKVVGEGCQFVEKPSADDWMALPWAYDEAAKAAKYLIEVCRPEGEIRPLQMPATSENSDEIPPGLFRAFTTITQLSGSIPVFNHPEWIEKNREMLGKDMLERIRKNELRVLEAAVAAENKP